jgi:hypothetical protein
MIYSYNMESSGKLCNHYWIHKNHRKKFDWKTLRFRLGFERWTLPTNMTSKEYIFRADMTDNKMWSVEWVWL